MPPQSRSVYRAAFQACLVVVVVALALWLIYEIRQILVSVAVAVVLAAAIAPLVSRLERMRVPRSLAILLVYVAVLGGLAGALVVALPPLAREGSDLVARLVESAGSLERFVASAQASLGITDGAPFEIESAIQQALQASSSMAPGLLRITFGAVTGIFSLLLVLAITFYWLMERHYVEATLLRLLPEERRGGVMPVWREVESKLGAYVRGQLLDASAVGVLTLAGLLLLGVHAPLPLALLAAITGLIPIVGATVGAIPGVLIAFSDSPEKALLTLVMYLVVQQIEGNLIAPRIFQQSVGVSPLTVLLAIVIGGSLMGIIGAILAIPTAAATQVVVTRVWLRREGDGEKDAETRGRGDAVRGEAETR